MKKIWLLPLVLVAGCLERKEIVTVRADGTVTVKQVLEGDASEFDKGDALPSRAPWTIKDEELADKKKRRTAEASFARVEAIPETEGDAASLHARSTLTTEALPEGKRRWTFERRYSPRAYAWRERILKLSFTDELKKELEATKPWTPELERKAIAALVSFEKEKNLAFLEDALSSAGERATPRARLAARQAFSRAFDAAWNTDALLPLLKASPEEQQKLEARFRDEMLREAVKAGVAATSSSDEKSISDEFQRLRKVLEVTESLNGHRFEVRIEMPAKVTVSDASSVDGNVATFKFGGEDLHDREHVIRVVAEGSP